MYLRTVQRKNRDGSAVRYVQLAHNRRDPATGKPQAQILWSFGREEDVDFNALQRLVGSIQRYIGPEEELRGAAPTVANGTPLPVGALNFVSSRSYGGAHLLSEMWKQLGIGQAIRKVIGERGFKIPVEQAVFAMVANRALAPCSKLGVEQWLQEDVALPGIDALEAHQLYRAMDVLIESQAELQKEVYHAVADLLNLEVDLLFLDTTSSYFEIEGEDPANGEDEAYRLRQRGYSKDHRPDLAQVVIGLAVTRQGIPIRCWVWPGNTVDVNVIAEVKRDLMQWKLGRVITVVDRGFMSEANLETLQRAGGHYIAGEKMRGNKRNVDEALSRAGRYSKVQHNIEVKEIFIGTGETRERYILARNPQRAVWDRDKRNDILRVINQELERVLAMKRPERSKAMFRLLGHPVYGRYLKLNSKGVPELDQAKVKAEERLDGKYLLRTSDDSLDPAEVAIGYKQLLEVEAAFRTLKGALELRPVYHRLSRRIEAHVVLCWLALLLVRIVEVKLGEATGVNTSWETIRKELGRLHLGMFEGAAGRVWQRTELRALQEQIYRSVGVQPPPKFSKMEPAIL